MVSTLPTDDSSVSFSAEVTSTSANQLTQNSVQKNLIDALRQQAPLASLSGGDAAAKPQSVIYTFSGPTVIDPTPGTGDSLNLTVAGTNLTVDMSDADGMGTAVTTAQLMTEAAARLVNNAALGVTATAYSDPVDIARVDFLLLAPEQALWVMPLLLLYPEINSNLIMGPLILK